MKPKILLIEDNAQNRYLTTFLLERHGFEITAAESGPEGVDLARQNQPDLVLLDIQLPGMDGHAVARLLKRDPALRHIPVVAVTSYAMPGDRERCLEAGAEGYIEKPIDPDTFITQIRRFIGPAGNGEPGS